MRYQKYMQDLLQYQFVQGITEEFDEYLIIAA